MVAFLLQVLNVLAVFSEPSAGFYLASLWLYLGTVGSNFVSLVFQRLLAPPAA